MTKGDGMTEEVLVASKHAGQEDCLVFASRHVFKRNLPTTERNSATFPTTITQARYNNYCKGVRHCTRHGTPS